MTDALRSADSGELMRRLLHTILQALIDAEATAQIGAGPHERTETRTTQRNGSRDKLVATTAGDLTVKIPKLRAGSFFPSLLAPRRRIDQAVPYVFLDATYCTARVNGRVVSRAVVIATGVAADGRREVLGCDVGDSENEVFWTAFLRGLRDRGLAGVQLVISDSHRGLTNAIDTVLAGARLQQPHPAD